MPASQPTLVWNGYISDVDPASATVAPQPSEMISRVPGREPPASPPTSRCRIVEARRSIPMRSATESRWMQYDGVALNTVDRSRAISSRCRSESVMPIGNSVAPIRSAPWTTPHPPKNRPNGKPTWTMSSGRTPAHHWAIACTSAARFQSVLETAYIVGTPDVPDEPWIRAISPGCISRA